MQHSRLRHVFHSSAVVVHNDAVIIAVPGLARGVTALQPFCRGYHRAREFSHTVSQIFAHLKIYDGFVLVLR